MTMKKMVLQIMRSAVAVILMCFTAIVPAAGAENAGFKVSLSTDRNNVVAGGNVNVTLTFSHTDLNDSIRLPEVKGGSWRTDRVSQSSSTRIINGRREESVSYSLPLAISAPAGSTVEIPAATFKRRNGQSAATAPVTIKVLEAGAVPPEERISAAILLPEGGRKYYTGEDIPLEFRLSIPYRMRLRSAEYPRISGLEQGIIADYSKVNPRNPRFAPIRR